MFYYLTEKECSERDLTAGKLPLNKCDIYKVLANGATLFGSQGAEYDVQDIDGIEIISSLASGHIACHHRCCRT